MRKTLIALVLFGVVAVAGCLGGDDGKLERVDCPLPATNPLDCMEGVLRIQGERGCTLIKCREDLNGTEKIIEDLTAKYSPAEVRKVGLAESEAIAQAFVLDSRDYVKHEGYGLAKVGVRERECPYCFTVIYAFDGTTEIRTNAVAEYTMTVNVKQGNVTSAKTSRRLKKCAYVGECIPMDAPYGLQFACESETCMRRIVVNAAASMCVSRNGRSEVRKRADGTLRGYCIFPDGTECEEWDYYKGNCPKVEKPPKEIKFDQKAVIEPLLAEYGIDIDDYNRLIEEASVNESEGIEV